MVSIRTGRVPLLSPSRATFLLLFWTNFAWSYVYGAWSLTPPSHGGTASLRITTPNGDIAHCPPSCACSREAGYHHLCWSVHGDQQCHPQNSHPRESMEKERKKRKLASYKLQISKPQPQAQTQLVQKGFCH